MKRRVILIGLVALATAAPAPSPLAQERIEKAIASQLRSRGMAACGEAIAGTLPGP